MRVVAIGLIVLSVALFIPYAHSQNNARPTIANVEDFHRAMKELSNWGRWGADDELGAANLITPAKRKQALALATQGLADESRYHISDRCAGSLFSGGYQRLCARSAPGRAGLCRRQLGEFGYYGSCKSLTRRADL